MNQPDQETIRRVLAEQGTPQEAEQVARWFASTKGQEQLAQIVDMEAQQIESGVTACASDIPSEALYRRIRSYIARRRLRRIALRVAAILIPCALILAIGIRLDRQVGGLFAAQQYTEVYVPKGERMQMVFQDGTRVYLNSDTKLRYPRKFGLTSRQIYLDGEAYFMVQHNPARPFVVGLDDVQIKVLGTEFNVKSYKDSPLISVSLDHGSVSMSDARRSFLLAPSDVLTYNKATGQGHMSHTNTATASLWRQDVIAFKDAPLSEVMQTLNRWYNVQFELINPRAYTYYYTFTTRDSSLEKILSEMERISPLRFTRTGNTITVDM